MTSALDALVANPPSEYGGARASNRFHFQKDWTFCLLLKLHVTGKDYLVVCDYHDDVLVLDNGSVPTRVDFYQIKTRSGKRWTINQLLHQEQGATGPLPSILGKLYRHRTTFGTMVGATNIVSNLPFSVKFLTPPPSESRIEFTAHDLPVGEKDELRKAIRAQLSLASDPVVDATMVFQVTELSLQDHRTHTRGKLADYLESRDPTRAYPIQAVYRAVVDEIGRRIDEENPVNAVVDLLRMKGISRDNFEKMIVTCLLESDRPDPRVVADSLEANLSSEGVPFMRRRSVRRSLERYAIERLDSSQLETAKCAEEVSKFVVVELPKHKSTLWDFLLAGLAHLRKADTAPNLDDDYVVAVVAWEVLANGK